MGFGVLGPDPLEAGLCGVELHLDDGGRGQCGARDCAQTLGFCQAEDRWDGRPDGVLAAAHPENFALSGGEAGSLGVAEGVDECLLAIEVTEHCDGGSWLELVDCIGSQDLGARCDEHVATDISERPLQR